MYAVSVRVCTGHALYYETLRDPAVVCGHFKRSYIVERKNAQIYVLKQAYWYCTSLHDRQQLCCSYIVRLI